MSKDRQQRLFDALADLSTGFRIEEGISIVFRDVARSARRAIGFS